MENTKLAKNCRKDWLALAVSALAISGLFTILLIVARTSTHKYFAEHDLFNASLIVHVNLGVLVWLLSSYAAFSGSTSKFPFYMALLGTVMIILSPFISRGVGYQNNYIPIFDNGIFKSGIALYLAAITLVCLEKLKNPISLLILLAMACFVASYIGMINKGFLFVDSTQNLSLYETLFWGGGHILQFAYVQIMITGWLILSNKTHPYPKFLWIPFALALISSAYIYAAYPVDSADYTTMFTKQMYWLSAVGVLVALPYIRFNNIAIFYSVALFFIGGSLGHMIGEVSTTVIPAHYHGSVMAVTISLMGMAYYKLGLKPNKWQLGIYFVGQATHVICMAVMGLHGASRKTPGDMGENTAKAWSHIMDTGGLLVLIGGIMFVVIVLRNLRKAPISQAH